MSTLPATGGKAHPWFEREGQLVLGAMIRPLGAFPSGWRYPGAHNDPADDPAAIRRVAREAEKYGFDYLFLGDWLSINPELEFTDPYLLARVDPLSTAGFLAGVTKKIGLIATASVHHSDPYAIARTAASLDRLSAGRFGLNLTVGTDQPSTANFGPARAGDTAPFALAQEYIDLLRALWDSFPEEALARDAAGGRLLDADRITSLEHVGQYFSVAGPLNVLRPPQGHVPLMHAGLSPHAREFAAANADVHFVAPSSLGDAVRLYRDIKYRVRELGRRPEALTIVAPILPIVGITRDDAHRIYDELVALVPLDDGTREAADLQLPPHRDISSLAQLVGLPLIHPRIDSVVPVDIASRFNSVGARLIDTVTRRSGRTVGGSRPVTYRHLVVANITRLPIIVGSPLDIADYLEEWYRASAVDGFNVLSAFLHDQFEAFTRLVVPELQSRGLFRTRYETSTLRAHLGSAVPPIPPLHVRSPEL